ncbi:MAG: nitroreductase family deazaflavin-dependent oxidoreductase [Candidatus Dadabacteria bacterium]|nr:MAG: nitroreductase family deazaflavin-dependent oxidoreductase [Candidatus Dadabacteria bacterium]
MPALKRNKAVELFWRLHRWVYRATRGKVGGRLIGLPVLLLTTKGRKSGQPRTVALTYLEDAGRYVVIASYLGEPRHPSWYLNLRANPEATVQVGSHTVRVRARDAEGEERERLWRRAVEAMPDYQTYQQRTSRRIPVVLLEPAEQSACA